MLAGISGLLPLAACASPTDSNPDGSVLTATITELTYPATTWIGQNGTRLSFRITNTGTVRGVFGASAFLRKPDEATVVDLPTAAIALSPGQTRTVSWDLAPWRPAGVWDVRAAVWRVSADRTTPPLADSGWLADVISTGFAVRYHSASADLTEAEAGVILGGGEHLLAHSAGAGDVACEVSLVLFAAPTQFSTGDGVIDNEGEYQAVLALPGNVKVVNEINWCGVIGAGITGCAPIPGFSFVVRRILLRDAETWAHEYGHTVGLEHSGGEENLMHASYSPGFPRSHVTAAQCSALRMGP
jgi:hypothetical protein